jgi:hypothetical protein
MKRLVLFLSLAVVVLGLGAASENAAASTRAAPVVCSNRAAAPKLAGKPVSLTGIYGWQLGTFFEAARGLRVLGASHVPADGDVLASGFGAVWAASSKGLVRLSYPTGHPTLVRLGEIVDVAVDSTRVYGLSSGDQLLVLDPTSLKVTRRIQLPARAHSITTGGGAVYVAFTTPHTTIERLDPSTGKASRTTVAGAVSLAKDRALAFGAGSLWLDDGANLFRLDPRTLVPRQKTAAGDFTSVWFGDGSAWLANDNQGAGVARVDPPTEKVTRTGSVDAIQIAFSPHGVWLAAARGPIGLDPLTAKVIAATIAYKGDTDLAGLAVIHGQLWALYADIGVLQRLALPGG